ncbi:hypothetical protein [Primorskyibacter sp. S87]|uniref:hypothetical protein n=1 Tax=Primorskyibacter sp. S87 TaxID=3415126 RepID=UPI003C7BE845
MGGSSSSSASTNTGQFEAQNSFMEQLLGGMVDQPNSTFGMDMFGNVVGNPMAPFWAGGFDPMQQGMNAFSALGGNVNPQQQQGLAANTQQVQTNLQEQLEKRRRANAKRRNQKPDTAKKPAPKNKAPQLTGPDSWYK